MLCLHIYLGWFLTGWLAPALQKEKKLSLSLFLIHSLLACCCSVSIEAELNGSVSGSNGFFIIIKMHYVVCEEMCVCVCVRGCVFCRRKEFAYKSTEICGCAGCVLVHIKGTYV